MGDVVLDPVDPPALGRVGVNARGAAWDEVWKRRHRWERGFPPRWSADGPQGLDAWGAGMGEAAAVTDHEAGTGRTAIRQGRERQSRFGRLGCLAVVPGEQKA